MEPPKQQLNLSWFKCTSQQSDVSGWLPIIRPPPFGYTHPKYLLGGQMAVLMVVLVIRRSQKTFGAILYICLLKYFLGWMTPRSTYNSHRYRIHRHRYFGRPEVQCQEYSLILNFDNPITEPMVKGTESTTISIPVDRQL